MNTEELNNIKDSSTKAFTAMAKNLYITGIRIYKEQEELEVLAAIMLDSERTESYLSHVKEYLAKRFDEHMEEVGKRERLWICPYISRHLLSLNPLQARCRRYSRGER